MSSQPSGRVPRIETSSEPRETKVRPDIKVTSVEPILLSCPVPKEHQLDWDWKLRGLRQLKVDLMIVKVTTDEGITGIGEPTNWAAMARLRSVLEGLRPGLLGQDPFDVERLATPASGAGYVANNVVAAVNEALWDITGKAVGKPIHKLLGGRYADRMEVYASAGQEGNTPEEDKAEAEQFRAEGFKGYKFRVKPCDFMEKAKAVKPALGEDVRMMVEWNSGLPNAKAAIRAIRKLEAFEPAWVENPLPVHMIDGFAEIRSAVDIPISGGEGFSTAWEFKEAIDRGAFDVVQPDCTHAGIGEARRAAFLAGLKGLPVAPHNWGNAISTAANLQVLASIPNHYILEINRTWNHGCPAFREEIVEGAIVPEDGYVHVPNRPGLGIELNERALARYPYIEGPVSAPI